MRQKKRRNKSDKEQCKWVEVNPENCAMELKFRDKRMASIVLETLMGTHANVLELARKDSIPHIQSRIEETEAALDYAIDNLTREIELYTAAEHGLLESFTFPDGGVMISVKS